MKINQSNYEIFFLDYLDGKLPVDQVDEFIDFLKNNPHLKEELKLVEGMKLEPVDYSFDAKEKLFKTEEDKENTFDYRAVAFIEDDLSEDEEKSFMEEMESDPEKEHEFDLLLSTKLPKEEIHFPNKKQLYKKENNRLVYVLGRAAAVILLLFAITSLFQKEWKLEPAIEPVYTEVKPPVIQEDNDGVPQKQEPQKKQESIEKIEKTVNDSIPAKKKSIREKAKGRLKEVARVNPIEREPVPSSLQALNATFVTPSTEQEMDLKGINESKPASEEYLRLDEYLAQKLVKLTVDEESTDLGKLATAGLEKVSTYSNDKISYQTNSQGKISEINLNTGLLAFSIPIKKNR